MMAELFTVNGITRTVRISETGQIEEVYEVRFTTKSGVSSSVDIPVDKFLPEFVRERIEAEARKIEDVLSL